MMNKLNSMQATALRKRRWGMSGSAIINPSPQEGVTAAMSILFRVDTMSFYNTPYDGKFINATLQDMIQTYDIPL